MSVPKFALVVGSLLILQISVAQGKAQISPNAVDPCLPSPCGPGAQCSVNSAGAAICRCQPGYFPKPDTITGCGPQCSQDYECRSTEKCQANRCVPTCQPSPCGVNAECESVNHKAVCRCPRGYTGDPLFQCTQQAPIARAIVSHPPPQVIRVTDPCSPNPCGVNAECRVSADRPVCTCLPNHQGNPLISCRRGECSSDSECPHHKVCENYHCVNPCINKCGANAHCDVRNHVPVCSCPPGYTGNPTTGCRRYDPNEACRACGVNTNCRVEGERAICSCKPGYFGDPLSGCRHECETDYDCAGNLACIDFKCKNPCAGACGTLANCEIRNHRAVCSCPRDYLGDPYTRCYPECTTHSECAPHLACIGLKCKDPCIGACGINAECRVDKYNHKAICSCPKGYTGHPFSECRRQTPDFKAPQRLCRGGCPRPSPVVFPEPQRICKGGCPNSVPIQPQRQSRCRSGNCPSVPLVQTQRNCQGGGCPVATPVREEPQRSCQGGGCPVPTPVREEPQRSCQGGGCPVPTPVREEPQRSCQGGGCPVPVRDEPRIVCPGGGCPTPVREEPQRICQGGGCPNISPVVFPESPRLCKDGRCPTPTPVESQRLCSDGNCPTPGSIRVESQPLCKTGNCPSK